MPTATVITPVVVFSVNPAGTVDAVMVTCPGLLPKTTGNPFKVSFDVKTVPEATFVSTLATIGLATTTVAVAVSQFAGTRLNPVIGLASHN